MLYAIRDRRDRSIVIAPKIISLLLIILIENLFRVQSQLYAQPNSLFIYPLAPTFPVIRPFSPGQHRWDKGHRGIDIYAPQLTPVFAAGSGIISYRGTINGIPNIAITHPAGFTTTYQPVRSSLIIGSSITVGEQIGEVDGDLPHCSHCLHWGAKYYHGHQTVYFDPLVLIGKAHIVLKPYTESE